MTLEEIKSAVNAGKTVHWSHDGYHVICDALGQWFIRCAANDNMIGLTWADNVTLNGKPEEFFTADERRFVGRLDCEPDTIYLDLPTPECCNDVDGDETQSWVHVRTFTDPVAAVAFFREHIDPYCDEQGRISILTNMPQTPKTSDDQLVWACKVLLASTCGNVGDDGYEGCIRVEAAAIERIRDVLDDGSKTPVGDLPRLLAVCKEVASMPGKDWLDGQLKLGKAIMTYEGELPVAEQDWPHGDSTDLKST